MTVFNYFFVYVCFLIHAYKFEFKILYNVEISLIFI